MDDKQQNNKKIIILDNLINWTPDSEQSSCFKCDRKFISFFRRRHHCR